MVKKAYEGSRYRIIGSYLSGHGFKNNSIVTSLDTSNGDFQAVDQNGVKRNVHVCEVEQALLSKEEIGEELNRINTRKMMLQKKLDYMTSTNKEEVDDDEFMLLEVFDMIREYPEAKKADGVQRLKDIIETWI